MQKKKSNHLFLLLWTLCLLLCIISGLLLFQTIRKQKASKNLYRSLSCIAEASLPQFQMRSPSKLPDTTKERLVLPALNQNFRNQIPDKLADVWREGYDSVLKEDYQKLFDRNNDFQGYLQIPDTQLDYPVLLCPEKNDYYLQRDFDKKISPSGNPYFDSGSDLKENSVLMVYGHNMKDGTMFGTLAHYKKQTYLTRHPYIFFHQWKQGQVQTAIYQIFSVIQIEDTNTMEFPFYDLPVKSQAEADGAEKEQKQKDYRNALKSFSLYHTNTPVTAGNPLLLLSTCDYAGEDGRLLLAAKKIYSYKK